jgi:hypothetical protein
MEYGHIYTPGGVILCAAYIQTRPFIAASDDGKSSEI